MQKSKAYQRVAPLLVCVVCLTGCTSKQEQQKTLPDPKPIAQADFNVAVAHDGRTIVWWLRMSGRDFTAMVHKSAANPELGSADNFTHQVVNTLISVGLVQHGLNRCPPVYSTVAVLKDGAVQFTGACVIPESVNVSSDGGQL